jgi:hypothetical protein
VGYLDFSPPVAPSSTGVAVPRPGLLPDFAEVAPPQGQVLGADRDHTIRYASRDCELAVIAATDPFELFPSDPGTTERVPHPGADAKLADLPGSCIQALVGGLPFIQTHRDHDDWAVVQLAFQRSGDAADAAIEPSDDQDLPTDDEIEQLRRLDRTIDLTLEAGATDDPVTVGTTLTVPVTVSNVGGVHSAGARLAVDGATGPTSVDLAELAPGARQTVPVPVPTTAAGTVTVRASVGDELMIEATPQDNSVTFDVVVADTSTDDGDDVDGPAEGDSGAEGSVGVPPPAPAPSGPGASEVSPSQTPADSRGSDAADVLVPVAERIDPDPSTRTSDDQGRPSTLVQGDPAAQTSVQESAPDEQPEPEDQGETEGQAESEDQAESEEQTSASSPGSAARTASSVSGVLLAVLALVLVAAAGTVVVARRR